MKITKIDTVNNEYGMFKMLFRKGGKYGIRHVNEAFTRDAGKYTDVFYKTKADAEDAWDCLTQGVVLEGV